MKKTFTIDNNKHTFDFLIDPKKIKNVTKALKEATECRIDCKKCLFESIGHNGCFSFKFPDKEKNEVAKFYRKYILEEEYIEEEMEL